MTKHITILLSVVLAVVMMVGSIYAESPADKAKPKLQLSIESTSNDLMSLNFFDVDIREVLSALALQREINIVAAPEVSGEISLHLFEDGKYSDIPR